MLEEKDKYKTKGQVIRCNKEQHTNMYKTQYKFVYDSMPSYWL